MQGNSSRTEAWMALHKNISAKITYLLPACTLSEQECKNMMFPAMKAPLPRSCVSAHMSSKIRDVPMNIGGVGALTLYHYMGTARTMKITV